VTVFRQPSVTVTYRYGTTLRTLVAPKRSLADAQAMRRWGAWDGDPCYSTPWTIYSDLTGITARQQARKGMRSPFTF
jgi:hypothetical protein